MIAAVPMLVMVAGDLGAEITHGENFLMAPVTPARQKKVVLFEEAFLYADVVQPVLEAKCFSCHNSKKAKGQLVMETADLLLRGGKSGKLWDTTQPDLGLLVRRIHLADDEKEHMPPSGKPQLTAEEMVILEKWIRAGGDMNRKVAELRPNDTLRMIAYKRLKPSAQERYDFEAADETTVAKLSNTNRVVYPLALNSPALVVNFYNSAFFNRQQLEELGPVKENLVELNLANMPVTDEDLKTIASFKNLRTLNLNYSRINGNTLAELKTLPHLKSLSLSGTAVKVNQLAILKEFPTLRSVFVWNTEISAKAVAAIDNHGKIHVETGFDGDKVIMKLTPPIVQNSDSVVTSPIPVRLKNYIPGTTVRYTTDGSDPDSTSSAVYKDEILVQKPFQLKARAVKPGWYSSDVVSHYFFTCKYVPDSAALLTPVDPRYRAKDGTTLIDLIKSEPSKGSGKWLGYQNNKFEALLQYRVPVTPSSVTVSMLRDLGGHIFPPTLVEIWGGTDVNKLRLLGTVHPNMAVKGDANDNLPLTCTFSTTPIQYIKIVASPLAKIPAWHDGKGKKAWIFVDEVMVN